MEFPFRKLELASPLSEEERAALQAACAREVGFRAHTDIAREGDKPTFSTVLIEGIVSRYKRLTDGRRQIIAFHTPGDWPDLHSYFLSKMDHSLMAMSACRVGQIPHPALRRLIRSHPRLGELLWRETMTDSAMFRGWVVSLGARDTHERAAHLFCEMDCKLGAIGMVRDDAFELPITQTDLADALGVSSVHSNRILQQLRREGVVSYDRGVVTIHDRDRLRRIGDFDPGYLHLQESVPLEEGASKD